MNAKAGRKVFLIRLSDLGLISPKGNSVVRQNEASPKNCQEKNAAEIDPVAVNTGSKACGQPAVRAIRKD